MQTKIEQRGIASLIPYEKNPRKNGGVPYLIEILGCDSFRFAAAGLHTKITLIRTACGKSLVIHGSANLRSSRNIEQFVIEDNPYLFAFNQQWMDRIHENFRITKTSPRGETLWQEVQEPTKKAS